MSAEGVVDWAALTNAELLALSGGALAELRERAVVRTANAPAGDLAERLVADAMGGHLAPNAQKSWDVLVAGTERVQVKARVVADLTNAGQRQVSAFRSWDCDSVMFVLFDPMYRVRMAGLVPAAVVRAHSRRVDFTASDRVFATDAMLALGEDWTERLQSSPLWCRTRDDEAMRQQFERQAGYATAELSEDGSRGIRDVAGRWIGGPPLDPASDPEDAL